MITVTIAFSDRPSLSLPLSAVYGFTSPSEAHHYVLDLVQKCKYLTLVANGGYHLPFPTATVVGIVTQPVPTSDLSSDSVDRTAEMLRVALTAAGLQPNVEVRRNAQAGAHVLLIEFDKRQRLSVIEMERQYGHERCWGIALWDAKDSMADELVGPYLTPVEAIASAVSQLVEERLRSQLEEQFPDE